MPVYRVFLCPFKSGSVWRSRPVNPFIELYPELPIRFGYGLNQAGSCSVSALKKPGSASVTLANCDPGRTALWVQRGSTLVWGGIVWDLRSSSRSPTIEITAEEFFSYFAHLRLDASMPTWVNVPHPGGSVDLAATLVSGVPSLVGGLQMDTDRRPFTTGQPYAPQWHEWDNRMIDQIIDELAHVGEHTLTPGSPPTAPTTISSTQGFEFTQECRMEWPGDMVTPGWSTGAALVFHSPRAGADLNFPVVEWGPGTRDTAIDVSWSRSARKAANRLKVTGRGTGSIVQASVADLSATYGAGANGWPRMDAVRSFPELAYDEQTAAVALDTVARIATPPVNVQATMRVGPHFPWGAPDVYMPGQGWWPVRLGDRIPTRIKDWDLDLRPSRLRLIGFDVEVHDLNTELAKLSLQTDTPYVPT